MTIGIEVVETTSLGDRTHLVHDGHRAVAVDPQRDIDRVLAAAGRLGVTITHVAETTCTTTTSPAASPSPGSPVRRADDTRNRPPLRGRPASVSLGYGCGHQ
jgi:hypothetical protein